MSLARQWLGDWQTTLPALLLMLYLNNKVQELCIMLVRQNCHAYCLLYVVCSVIGVVDNLMLCDKSNGLKFMVGLCF